MLGRMMDMRLTAILYGGDGTNLFEFRPAEGGEVPAFTAGAHVDLLLPNGMVRQYSIASPEADRSRYLLGIKREQDGRGGSRYIHDALRVGELLRVSEPRNNFPLFDRVPHSVFIAGGIGITPIRCLVDRAERLGLSCELHYAVRRRDQALFLPELRDAQLHIDAEHDGQPLDLAPIVGAAPRDAHLYCCGPAGMLDGFASLTRDWPARQLHLERFAHPEPPSRTGASFTVELARSGRRLEIPADRTILAALREAGVVAGQPAHRDVLLSELERTAGREMMICCSRSHSPVLVLDL